MSGDGAPAKPGLWARRILRSVLPAGLVFLLVWLLYVVVALAIGGEQFGLTIVQALLGLLTSLILIASGHHYRRSLREE